MQTDTKIGSKQYHIQKIFGYDTILMQTDVKIGLKHNKIQKINQNIPFGYRNQRQSQTKIKTF